MQNKRRKKYPLNKSSNKQLSCILFVVTLLMLCVAIRTTHEVQTVQAQQQEETETVFFPFHKKIRKETEPTPSPTPTPTPVYEAKLTFVGDLMVHQAQLDYAYDRQSQTYLFDAPFSMISPYLKDSDYTLGNLETTFAGKERNYSDYPIFNTPDQFGYALKNAGIDCVTTANNHSNDKQEAGILRTLDILDEIGLDHFGTYRSEEERQQILIKEINGIQFAFLSYTYGTNGILLPKGKDYLVNPLDKALIQSDIARAKEINPDFIVIMPHMGNEYELIPQDTFKQWAQLMFDSGADVVIASHPHVVQPMEYIPVTDENGVTRTCFVAYSMGNFISSQRTKPRETGIILNMQFEKIGDSKAIIKNVSYIPTWVKFTNTNGQRDILVMPVVDTIKAYQQGENVDLRPKDIQRVQTVHKELAERILGSDIPPEEMSTEYLIKR